jgi:hypothetical protein
MYAAIIVLELASGQARAQAVDPSRAVKAMSTCKENDSPTEVRSRIVIGEGPTLESAKSELLNHCIHDSRGGQYLGKVATCADGYYVGAYTMGYCGAPTVKAAILGLVKQFPNSATPDDKERGITYVLARGIQLGYLTSKGRVEVYCEYVGADTKGNIFPHDIRYGTGEAFCEDWDYGTKTSGPGCHTNNECFSYFSKQFALGK